MARKRPTYGRTQEDPEKQASKPEEKPAKAAPPPAASSAPTRPGATSRPSRKPAKFQAVVDAKEAARVTPDPSPAAVVQAPPGNPFGAARVVWSLAEAREQLRWVSDLMVDGVPKKTIAHLLRGKWAGIGPKRVEVLMERVRADWFGGDAEEERKQARFAAIERLHKMRRIAAGKVDPKTGAWAEKPNHSAVARYESLLMDLEGTRKPVVVDVNVRHTQAMLAVVANLSGDEAGEYLAEALEQERLARIAMEAVPALCLPPHAP